MPRNIEVKASVPDLAELKRRVAAFSDTTAERIPQEDTFFHVADGRLKLRVLGPEYGQLIYYQRPDATGPKESDYHLTVTTEPKALKNVLERSLAVRGVVNKVRWLFLIGQTRIHLDQVDGLGSFVELEVVLEPHQDTLEGQLIATELMAQLGIREEDLIDRAYIDLLESPGATAKG